MIIQCENCSRKFIVKDSAIPSGGRKVQCNYCSSTWHQMPVLNINANVMEKKKIEQKIENDDSPSVESIKASDGKTYRFLGSQWAELLPSGKTGLFARRKISRELDEVTGRKEKKIIKKRFKKIEKVNPSESINTGNEKQSNYVNNKNKGLGFFGYIFLLIIVGFSIVGILKTFEEDLINAFPEIEIIFELLDQQLIYLSESVKNIIVIINDLTNYY